VLALRLSIVKSKVRTYAISGTRITHRMSTISVSDIFIDQRTFASAGPLLTVLDGSLDGQDVHAVDLETWDILTTLVVIRQRCGTIGCSSHTVLVVWLLLC